MIKLACQFSKHSGPMFDGSHRIYFEVQKEFAAVLYKALLELEEAPQVVLHVQTITNQDQATQTLTESDTEKQERYNKKIHALFGVISLTKGMSSEEYKTQVKSALISAKIIKESLNELTLSQQLDVINKLENIIEEKNDRAREIL